MPPAISELANVLGSILPDILALPIELILDKVSEISAPISKVFHPQSTLLVTLEVALIDVLVELVVAKALHLPILPSSLVETLIDGVKVPAFAMLLTVDELTLVDAAVGLNEDSSAVSLPA